MSTTIGLNAQTKPTFKIYPYLEEVNDVFLFLPSFVFD
jgi:hypothetical protein